MLQPAIRLICRTEGALAPGASAPLSIHWRTRLTTPSDRFMRYSLGPPHCLERLGFPGADFWLRRVAEGGLERIIALGLPRASINGARVPGCRASQPRHCAVQKHCGTVLTKTPGFC